MADPFPFVAGDVLTAAELNGIGETVAYTPTMTSWVKGNGTLTGTYNRVNKMVTFTVKLVVGSTTTFAGSPTFSIPFAYSNGAEFDCGVNGLAYDASANVRYPLSSNAASTTTFASLSPQTNGAYLGTAVSVTSAIPMTWATGDVLLHTFTYQVA
jgi:hypothetical protein